MIANKKGYSIDEYDQNSYEIFALKGKIIFEYEQRTKQIMEALEKAFR